jgi:hypothetical protein
MPDADPLTGDDPYEILGVSRDDSLKIIREQKEALLQEYRSRMREARQEDDVGTFKRSSTAVEEIGTAWEWLERNHEPVDTDEPSSEASEAAAALNLPADAAPGTIEVRRERLLDEHRERMRKARHEDDNKGFKTAADRIKKIERAAERLLAKRSESRAGQESASDRAAETGGDGPALSAADPYERLGLSRVTSEAELAGRRDELVAEYTAHLTPETYADEPWQFRQAFARWRRSTTPGALSRLTGRPPASDRRAGEREERHLLATARLNRNDGGRRPTEW